MSVAQRRPILSQSCALATTAAEYGYRIQRPNSADRQSCIVALDEGARSILERLATRTWVGARFLTFAAPSPSKDEEPPADEQLHTFGGQAVHLVNQLVGADVVVMIATGDAGSQAADAIGTACAEGGVMTAGMVVGDRAGAEEAINALRPNAMVLVVLEDEQDATDVLTALRA